MDFWKRFDAAEEDADEFTELVPFVDDVGRSAGDGGEGGGVDSAIYKHHPSKGRGRSSPTVFVDDEAFDDIIDLARGIVRLPEGKQWSHTSVEKENASFKPCC